MRVRFWPLWLLILAIVACSTAREMTEIEAGGSAVDTGPAALTRPNLAASSDEDGPIRIVATTGIIGDVALSIAGEDAEVETLMAPNQDPHTYQTTAGDLRLAVSADAVLVNGWRLEEGLIDDLANAAGDVPLVPVSAGINPRYYSGDQSGGGNQVDPHVWLAPANVIIWADNIEFVLSTLDPENSGAYAKRADGYRQLLRELDAEIQRQLEPLPSEQRMLVTNHDAFGYFADAYGFTVVGTILPGDSSLAEPSSQELAELVERMQEASICSLFMEHSANQRLASQLAAELDHCDSVGIVELYSGALGDAGSGAETYLGLMEANLDMITTALAPFSGASNGN